jgi:hypothetical protein
MHKSLLNQIGNAWNTQKKYGYPFIFLDYPWSRVYLFMFAGFVLYSRIPIFSTDATIIIIYYIALCWV